MKARRGFYNLIAVIVLIAATILALISGVGNAYAATTRYSGVLEDLQQDSNFDVANYPAVNDDYSLKVIQVAESTDGELFIYVYQPAAKSTFLTATCLNMALSDSVDGTQLYNLTYLNGAGVFQKYRVDGVTVSSEEIRYYNITSIYRPFDSDIDEGTGNDNEINEIAFEVGKLYTVTTIDNRVNYSVFEQKVITITEKWCSYLLYPDGYYLTHSSKTASFFVAFDCNYNIENLLEADLTYTTRSFSQVSRNGTPYEPTYGQVSDPQYITLHYDDYGTNINKVWLFGETATWKRIQSKEDFFKSDGDKLTDEAKKQLANKKWVLRFLDSNYNQTISVGEWDTYTSINYTEVNDVAVLRLKFETQGTTYNLGVVDNKQSVSKDPANKQESWWDIFLNWLASKTGIPVWLWKLIFALLPFIILLPILSLIFPAFGQILGVIFGWIFKAVGKIIVWILKAVWWIISLPFRGIAALIRKRKEAAPAKAAPSKSRKARTPKKKSRTSRTKTPRTSRKK